MTACRIRHGGSAQAFSASSASTAAATDPPSDPPAGAGQREHSSIRTRALSTGIRPDLNRLNVTGCEPTSAHARCTSEAAAWTLARRATATSRRKEFHGVPPRSSFGWRGTLAAKAANTSTSAAHCRDACCTEAVNAVSPARNSGSPNGPSPASSSPCRSASSTIVNVMLEH